MCAPNQKSGENDWTVNKAGWKKRIKQDCIKAGTYADWCDNVIDSLASILEKRDAAEEQYKLTNSKPIISHTNKAGATNLVKNPTLVMWNDLNTSALSYWRDLGLTPSAFRKLTGDGIQKEKGGGLAEVLRHFENG